MGATADELAKRPTKAKVARLKADKEGRRIDTLHDGEGYLTEEAADAVIKLIALVERNGGWIAINANAHHDAIKVTIKEGSFAYSNWLEGASPLRVLYVSLGEEVWPTDLHGSAAGGASGDCGPNRGL